ncbi:MAG: late competence development ComFB family protein [Clostridiales bacterium]|jgi:competence protein ComFB|nr:late competence development ComFB family protein [Clostridiales bacterium]
MAEQKETVKNYMRDCVNDVLNVVMEKVSCCSCEKCRMDVIAMALNALPPKYIVTKKGELYSKLSKLQQQFEVDVMREVARAAELVSKRPRHGDS